MHSQDTINQLIDLRSGGKSCRAIAAALNMSVGAAHKLAQDHDDEIQQLAFARREALRERYLASFEGKLSDLANELRSRLHPLPPNKNEHFQYKNEHPWGWGGVQK